MPSTPLQTFWFADGACIAQARPQPLRQVDADSSALPVMTNLAEVRAATVSADLTRDQVKQATIQNAVRMLFVAAKSPFVDGIVSLAILRGERPITLVQRRHVRRTEVERQLGRSLPARGCQQLCTNLAGAYMSRTRGLHEILRRDRCLRPATSP